MKHKLKRWLLKRWLRTCPLCLGRTYDQAWSTCTACGVTDEALVRAGMAPGALARA